MASLLAVAAHGQSAPPALTAGPLTLAAFTAQFARDGTLVIEGTGWPTFKGTWTLAGGEMTLITPDVPKCGGPGRYRLQTEGDRVRFELVADECQPRRWILDRSDWRPAGVMTTIPPRRITRTAAPLPPLPPPAPADASWPSFRGRDAAGVADGQRLPDRWNGTTGENILWQATIPGLGHSSPIVWGDRVFVTSAASSGGDLATGTEIYRQRLAHLGSGFSASPVAADGKIYLSSEDGEMLVLAAGREFSHVATNSMGDLLMATPALANGVMYVRSARKLFAVAAR